jgi:hypothetical protein
VDNMSRLLKPYIRRNYLNKLWRRSNRPDALLMPLIKSLGLTSISIIDGNKSRPVRPDRPPLGRVATDMEANEG